MAFQMLGLHIDMCIYIYIFVKVLGPNHRPLHLNGPSVGPTGHQSPMPLPTISSSVLHWSLVIWQQTCINQSCLEPACTLPPANSWGSSCKKQQSAPSHWEGNIKNQPGKLIRSRIPPFQPIASGLQTADWRFQLGFGRMSSNRHVCLFMPLINEGDDAELKLNITLLTFQRRKMYN